MSELANVAGQRMDARSGLRMSAATATGIWLLLLAATITSWWIARGNAFIDGSNPLPQIRSRVIASVVIIGLADFKIYLVLDIFMGLRRAPAGWRIGVASWLFVTSGAILFFVLKS